MLYIVCFLHRSGSNHLCAMLESMGLGSPREYYEPKAIEARTSPEGYLKEWLEPQGTIAGVKAGYDAFAVMRQEVGYLLPHLDTRYIYLTRRDKLRQAISWERADQTDTWSSFQAEGKTPRQPVYDEDAINKRLAYINSHEQQWEAYLRDKPYLHLVYEELSPAAAYMVANYLGVKPNGEPKSGFQVQRDELTEQWVSQYKAGRYF